MNSVTRMSTTATYTNVPAAMPVVTAVKIVAASPESASDNSVPISAPSGVMHEYTAASSSMRSGRMPSRIIEMPSANASTHLCAMMAMKMSITDDNDDCTPIASPAMIECTDSTIISTIVSQFLIGSPRM